jgi:GTP-binding protein HflX
MAEKAIIAGVRLQREDKKEYADTFQELKLLAWTAGAEVVGEAFQVRGHPDAKTFIGKGKIDEIAELIKATGATLVILNEELSPSQQKNLEDKLATRVLDRVGLILDIFAKRAQTQEAKLQVELAQYEYLLPRLTKMWLHFSKQAGYVGTKGPGETQLEVDRRRISTRIQMLKKKTKEVRKHHQLLRDGRQKRGAKTVALVGYTNAGKSTLLNALTNSNVYVEDKLFATLDPTVRQLYLPLAKNVVISDTVGFIQRLPHQLVNSFKATLDEVVNADLLLHVIDSAADTFEKQMIAVLHVLEDLGAAHKPTILVFNKADKLSAEMIQEIKNKTEKYCCEYVFVSALQRTGLEELLGMAERALVAGEEAP